MVCNNIRSFSSIPYFHSFIAYFAEIYINIPSFSSISYFDFSISYFPCMGFLTHESGDFHMLHFFSIVETSVTSSASKYTNRTHGNSCNICLIDIYLFGRVNLYLSIFFVFLSYLIIYKQKDQSQTAPILPASYLSILLRRERHDFVMVLMFTLSKKG